MLIRIKAFFMATLIMSILFSVGYTISIYPMLFIKVIFLSATLFLFSLIYMGFLNKYKRMNRKKTNNFFK